MSFETGSSAGPKGFLSSPPPGSPDAATIAGCLVLACALQLAENLLPKFPLFPWMKLGLSHLVLLPFLLRFGAGPAIALTLSRTLLIWMVAGTPLSTMMVALAAGLTSLSFVGLCLRPLARWGLLGWVGLSVASAAIHNMTQLVVVEFLLVDHAGFYFQLTPLLLWSVASGTFMALLAAAALPFWVQLFDGSARSPIFSGAAAQTPAPTLTAWNLRHKVAFFAGLAVLAVILISPDLRWQSVLWLVLVLLALWPRQGVFWRKRFRSTFKPMWATWPFLIFLAWLHLFHGEGHLIGLAGLTQEGVQEFVLHGLRLLNLVVLGPRLLQSFPRHLLERSASPYAHALLLALPALASLPSAVPSAARQLWAAWRKGGSRGFAEGLAVFAAKVMP